MAMTALLGVQIGRLRGQPFDRHPGMGREIRLHDRGPMGGQAIPDEDKWTRNRALKMAEGNHNLSAPNRLLKVSFVNLARQAQGDHGRPCAAFTHATPNRGLTHRSPRGGHFGLKGKPHLIHKY